MISFNAGIPHTTGVPVHDPGAFGSRLAYDYVAKVRYRHVSGSSWEEEPTGGGGTFDGERIVTAGENLSAGRLVVIDNGSGFYFQPTDASHAGRTLGITKNAAITGGSVTVQFVGEVTDASFSAFSDAVLWAGNNGSIQTTIPATGTVQKVGHGIGSNTILIDFSTQITR